MIPVAKPYFDEKEERAAAEAIRSGWVVQGPRTMEFEKMVAERLDAKYALAISNCTTALHLALIALGIGPGDAVLVPSYSFIATANSVLHAGATSVFVDIDARTYNIDPQLLEEKITPRMRAIMPVHQIGLAADIDTIHDIACKHNLVVIEDAATIIGGTYKGKYVGTFGDLGCFSISAYKIVGGGEGGLVVTNDKRLWERASQLAECGGLWRPDRFALPRYEGELFTGTNYRMSELEAAIDVVQLKKMPATVRRSHAVKMRILKRLKRFREITPQVLDDPDGDVGYLLRFFPETVELGQKILEGLRGRGINAAMRGKNALPDWHIYCYMYPLTQKHGVRRGDCPVADDLFDRVITIWLNQWYNAADCRQIAHYINATLSECCTPDQKAPQWC